MGILSLEGGSLGPASLTLGGRGSEGLGPQEEPVPGEGAGRPGSPGQGLRQPGQHPLPAGELRGGHDLPQGGEWTDSGVGSGRMAQTSTPGFVWAWSWGSQGGSLWAHRPGAGHPGQGGSACHLPWAPGLLCDLGLWICVLSAWPSLKNLGTRQLSGGPTATWGTPTSSWGASTWLPSITSKQHTPANRQGKVGPEVGCESDLPGSPGARWVSPATPERQTDKARYTASLG